MFTPAPARRNNAPLTTASKSSRKLPGPLGETTAKKQRTGAAAEPDVESVVDEFAGGPWQCMLRAVLRQPSRDNTAAPFAHSIRSICKKAYLKPVPQLAVILKSIAAAEWGDALVTVRDPTGEMQGTLHRYAHLHGFISNYCCSDLCFFVQIKCWKKTPKRWQ
jgi:hypothetical protein